MADFMAKQVELGSIPFDNDLSKTCQAAKKDIPIQRRTASTMLWQKIIGAAMTASKFVNIISNRRQTYAMVDEKGGVSLVVKIMFAAPQFALISLTLLINVFIIKFYLDVVKVSAAFIAFFQIFARSFDVLTDPLMAHVSDNLTHTRIGRRMPWMMLCPLYAIAFFILVSPPLDNPSVATFWFGGSYLFFYFCDTLINVPFQALGPELTDDSDERTSLYMYVKVAEGIGIMIGTLLPAGLTEFLGPQEIYQLIALIFGTVYILSMYTLIRNIKERAVSTDETLDDGEKQPFVTSMYRSMRNRAFRPLVIGWILDFAAMSFIATMVPFYVKYYIEVDTMSDADNLGMSADQHLSYVMACFFVASFVSIPIWKYLSSHHRTSDAWYERLKVGKINAWLSYNVFNVVTNLMFVFVPEHGLYYLYICMIFNGIPVGGQFLINSILADVIDYDEFLNYKRNEGQFTVFASFVPKIIAIPCQSFPLVGMFMLGYTAPESDPTTGEEIFQAQPIPVKWFIRGMFVFAPLVLVSVSFLVKRTYPIKKYKQIQDLSRGITLHMQGKAAIDCITGEEVYIEDYTQQETHLIYLLDQFSHENLLWLLSPDQIWKRHETNQQILRKSTLKHLRGLDDIDIDEDNIINSKSSQSSYNNEKTKEDVQTSDENEIRNTRGCCSCFDTKIKLSQVIRNKRGVEFGKDNDGKIVYVAVKSFEAHGVQEGVKRIKIRVLIWILMYLSIDIICITGLSTTMQLLQDPDWAFVPAVFCLCTGLSLVGVGFNVLRYRAAEEIKNYIQKENISDEILARCIYPKTKGQHGGEAMDNKEDKDAMKELLPDQDEMPHRLKSLTNMDFIVNDKKNNGQDDLYS